MRIAARMIVVSDASTARTDVLERDDRYSKTTPTRLLASVGD
jgi:hypothetical protein